MKVSEVKAVGHSIVVEIMTEQEASGSLLVLKGDLSKQAYVKDIGSLVQDCGLKVGDRVFLQGTYVPLPFKSEKMRVLATVDLHNIKAVLKEEAE